MRVKEITAFLETIAPLSYQENYDNSGLLVGAPEQEVKGILVTLDCIEDIVEEAIRKECNLIVTHHPIIFSGLKRISSNNHIERTIIKAIKNDIAIYAIHTNLDNAKNGVNARIAERLGLVDCKVLTPKKDFLRQLAVYCPISESEKVRKALFNAGAGTIGNYDNCSFNSKGEGTFRANEKCNPHVGEIGEMHVEEEIRIEVVFPKNNESAIISAMKKAHPYQEVAYQIYILDNIYKNIGSGIVGELKLKKNAEDFIKDLKITMRTNCVRYTNLIKDEIKRVALCGGSGSFLLLAAKYAKADIFISADFKYHEFFNAEKDIIIADIGHYESEQFTKDLIYDLLIKKFPKFAIRLSKVNTNPINYL